MADHSGYPARCSGDAEVSSIPISRMAGGSDGSPDSGFRVAPCRRHQCWWLPAYPVSDVLIAAPAVLAILVLAGGFTALFASIVMLTQPAVKTSLAWSTIAQMGFMILQCGLALFPLALLHILAHSLYKATRFSARVPRWRKLQRPAGLAPWRSRTYQRLPDPS
jgi:hypothetical protein